MENVRYRVTVQKVWSEEGTEAEYQKLQDTGGSDGGAKYGYVQQPVTKRRSEEIFTQTVEDLDLSDVVLTINRKETK